MAFLEDVFQAMPTPPGPEELGGGDEAQDAIPTHPTELLNYQITTAAKTDLQSAAPCKFVLPVRPLL